MSDILKDLIAIVKKSERCWIHAYIDDKRESWTNAAFITFKGTRRTKNVDSVEEIRLNGSIHNGHTSKTETAKFDDGSEYVRYVEPFIPTRGYWGTLYKEDLLPALNALPKGYVPTFEIRLEGGTNQLCVKAGLHCDFLYLVGRPPEGSKKEEVIRFLIDSQVSAHNSARFGAPRHDFDTVGGAS